MQIKRQAMKRNSMAALFFLLLFVMQADFPGSAYGREEKYVAQNTISGRVVDMAGKPLKSVRVNLWTKDGSVSLTSKTDGKGGFKFLHEKSPPCYLEVLPDKDSQLACATIDNIAGDTDRSIIVNLKRGFLVTGRVCSGEKGLSGLIVKVYSEQHSKNPTERVYGGGAVRTGRNGKFEMVLTPGRKHLVVINERFSELKKRTEANFDLSSDMELEDVKL